MLKLRISFNGLLNRFSSWWPSRFQVEVHTVMNRLKHYSTDTQLIKWNWIHLIEYHVVLDQIRLLKKTSIRLSPFRIIPICNAWIWILITRSLSGVFVLQTVIGCKCASIELNKGIRNLLELFQFRLWLKKVCDLYEFADCILKSNAQPKEYRTTTPVVHHAGNLFFWI